MNKEFRQRMVSKYASDKRYNANSEDKFQRYSLRNNFGFYFEYRKFRETVRLFNRESLELNDKKILDIGCHKGIHLNNLALLKGTSQGLYGIDFMPQFIKTAKEINSNIEYKQMDVYDLKFKDNYFDLINLIYFLNCIPPRDRLEVANSISKRLKVGGYILIFDMSDHLIINVVRKIVKTLKGNPNEYVEYINDDLVRKYFKGFEIVESKCFISFLSVPLSNYIAYPIIELLDYFTPCNFYIALLKKVKENN
jgi:ubiquinone/menaquinone biosynthesis C-methylase UbiE